jgi:hypothetical protein
MGDMLNISTDTLPRTCLSYLAFRVAFQETLERIMLADQMEDVPFDGFGYLTEVPFLQAVPPRVQLDLLAASWAKHFSGESHAASLVDESVVYAVCETTARVVENEPEQITRYLRGGPMDIQLNVDHFLASEVRRLHLGLSNEGDFLLISQFEDIHPEEADRLKKKFNLDAQRLECMFEALAHYHVSSEFSRDLTGLFEADELEKIDAMMNPRPVRKEER